MSEAVTRESSGSERVQDGSRPPIFVRQFVLACLINFSGFLILHCLVPTLPLYIKMIGGRDSDIGLVIGVANISSLFVRFVAGPMLDVRGRKVPLVGGAIIYLLAILPYSLIADVPSLVLLRLIQGVGFGAVTTACSVITADVVPPQRRGEAMSYYGNSASLAMAMAPAFAIYLVGMSNLPISGFTLLFGVCAAIGVILLVLALKTKETHHATLIAGSRAAGGLKLSSILSRDALPIALAMFFGSYTLGAISGFASVYLSTEDPNNVSIFFLVYASFMIVSRPVVGRIADRIDRRLVAIPLMLLVSLGTAIFAIGPYLPVALAVALVFGSSWGSLNATLLALTVDVVPPRERGGAMSAFMASVDLGIAIGAMTLGVVADGWGYRAVFLTSGLVGLAGLAYLLVYVRLSARSKPFSRPVTSMIPPTGE